MVNNKTPEVLDIIRNELAKKRSEFEKVATNSLRHIFAAELAFVLERNKLKTEIELLESLLVKINKL